MFELTVAVNHDKDLI